MHTKHIETVIIGAGQAGLATGYHLQRRQRPFVILDSESRLGDGWRHQWDSLRLYSPARVDSLPGLRFPARIWAYPSKDEFADYLESYAAHFRLPVRLGTRVERLAAVNGRGGAARYVVTTDAGEITADNVVVATGTFGRTPLVPDFADQLDPSILQLHSSEYRRPSQLPPGPVLVVGASHSGCDIAYEVAATRPTVLAGRDTGQIPVAFDSPLLKVVFPTMLFAFGHVLTRRNPIGRKQLEHFRFGGGPRLRVQTKDLEGRGVDWVRGRVTGVEDGRPVVAERGPVDVRTVIWCTGFRQQFGWVDLDIFDDHAGLGSLAESSRRHRACTSWASASSPLPARCSSTEPATTPPTSWVRSCGAGRTGNEWGIARRLPPDPHPVRGGALAGSATLARPCRDPAQRHTAEMTHAHGHAHGHQHGHGSGVMMRSRGYDLVGTVLFGGRRRRAYRELVRRSGARPGDRVLDVGCGTGYLTALLAEAVGPTGTAVGVDPSEAMVAQASEARSGPGVHYVVGFAESLGFEDGSFDVVTSSLALHHIDKDQRQAAAAEMARVLRPGGRVLVADFRPPSGRVGQWFVRNVVGLGMASNPVDEIAPLLGGAGFAGLSSGDAKPWLHWVTGVKPS